MQKQNAVAGRDAQADRLQPGTHPGHGAVVVGALDIDDLPVAALKLSPGPPKEAG